jgi:hypothetical protein
LSEEKVWVNFVLTGEPARIIREAKKRGIAKSTRDAVVQGLLALNDKMVERDLRKAQANAHRQIDDSRARSRRGIEEDE